MIISISINSSPSFSSFYKRLIRKAIHATIFNLPSSLKHKLSNRGERFTLSVSIVGAQTIKKLNFAYRKKNSPTDVLSFSRLETSSPAVPLLDIGDIVICLTIAQQQANEFKESLGRELERLAVHGALHLFGYDHEKSLADEKKMFALQNKILKGLSSKHYRA